MEKLYDRIDFHNDTTPALNETNLNAMSKSIDDIDDRLIEVANMIGSGGDGSTVEWNQIATEGTKIAQITINDTTTDVFAPNGGGGGTTSYYGTSAEFEEFKSRTDIPDGTEYIVTDDYVDKTNVYSEEETVIGKFLDKTLYRKVVKLSTVINTSTSEVATGIDVSYVDMFVKGIAIRTNADSRGTGCVDLYLHKKNNKLSVYSAPSSGGVSIIVMEYTKVGE